MFLIRYRERVALDSWRVVDASCSVVLSRCWFSGGLLYGYRDRFNVVCLVDDQIDSIIDQNNPLIPIDVKESFKIQAFAYNFPF